MVAELAYAFEWLENLPAKRSTQNPRRAALVLRHIGRTAYKGTLCLCASVL
jgi:hypothetical protein